MPKPRYNRTMGIVLLGLALLVWSVFVRVSPGFADVPVDEVHYTFAGPTSVTLDWRGTAPDVRYGPTSSYGSTATRVAPPWAPISSGGPFWQAPPTRPAPGTTFHHSIGGRPGYTPPNPPTRRLPLPAIRGHRRT